MAKITKISITIPAKIPENAINNGYIIELWPLCRFPQGKKVLAKTKKSIPKHKFWTLSLSKMSLTLQMMA